MIQADSRAVRLHYEMIRSLKETGACATNGELAHLLDVSIVDVEEGLQELADMHGVLLHPKRREPWLIHPFSLTPAAVWIEARDRGWWSPCVWCGLGVAAVIGGEVFLNARVGGEAEAVAIRVVEGKPHGDDVNLWVHFAVPPARAWDNVHEHCSMVLPFRKPADIDAWCARHRLPKGEAVPIEQVGRMAKVWYGRHADRDWRKWTISEAQEIFRSAGLVSPFWQLGGGSGRY